MKFVVKVSVDNDVEVKEVEKEVIVPDRCFSILNDLKQVEVSSDTANVLRFAIGQEFYNSLVLAKEGEYPQIATVLEELLTKL